MSLRAAHLVVAVLVVGTARIAAAQPARVDARVDAAAHRDDVPRGVSRFRSFGAGDGLRNLFIVSIVQDGNGFLWVATDDGVYRFDGQQFTHYSMQDGVPSMGVRSLGIAPNGAVCAGTRDGLACWNGARFTPAGAEGLPAVWIQTMASGPNALWAGTTTGLYVRRGDGPFAPAPGWPTAVAHPVRAIWADAEGVAVGDGDVLQVSTGDGTWRVLGPEVGLGLERIDAVLRDRDGALWIRSLHYLWKLPRGAAHVTDLSAGLASGSDQSGVSCGMAISPWGAVLVGSDRGVAYHENGAWQLVDRTAGSAVTEARAVFVDREGSIWIGSVGLVQWMGRGLVRRHEVANGLPADVVWTIARERGALWIGTGQCLARAVAGRWACMPASMGWSVRSFVFTAQGGIFLGGGPPDPLYIDPTGKGVPLELQGERVADRHVMGITAGPGGDIWFATTNGLFRLPAGVVGNPERVTVPGTRPDTRYISILHADGRLWVPGEAGLAVLDHGRWRLFDKTAGFRATAMRHALRRRDGRMCVSFTDVDGLTCFKFDGLSVSELVDISLADGMTSGRIYFLGEDRAQRLWIGTGDGVDVMTPTGVDHFSEGDGLAGNDSAARAFFEDDDGSVWLGASTGLTQILAQHYRGPPVPPRVALTASQLGGRPIQPRPGELLQVPHDHNAVAATFTSNSFVAPSRLDFQIRLAPSERDWSVTRSREARYAALPPGAYQLQMRARIGGGAWGAATELRFEVLPAWWQTRWFVAIAGGLVLAMAGGIITWRQRVVWRRRAEALHQQSNASARDLIESMPDLVFVHRDDELTYLNEAARQMLGLDGPGEPWRGVNLLHRIHPDDQKLAGKLFRDEPSEPHAPQAAHAVELRMRAGDASWRNCELSGRRLALGGEQVLVISGRDVTERHRLRAKLLLSDRMVSLGTLAAGIAHEINNPLAYVTGNLEVVAETLESGGSHDHHAELNAAIADAREGAERVRQIVRGLRTFSRSEEEKRIALALPDVIGAAIRMTGNELRHRAVLVRELGDTPLVLADEGRLAQVFINLLINAAHAIPEGNTDANRITVRTWTDDAGRAVIEIEDSGEGMPAEVMARAFDPFFTTKEVGEGTGLGLSICHGIVSGLGGQIAIESTRGHGSLVRVVLPPAPVDAAPPPTAKPAIVAAAGRRQRVLIVDDEPRVAQALKRMLHGDHDLTVASCGAEAIAHVVAGERFDAIITDVMMPNMTGIELFDRLEDLAPDQALRVIFLSGGVFTPQTQTRLEISGNPQLQKPVSSQELRACVAKLVARAA